MLINCCLRYSFATGFDETESSKTVSTNEKIATTDYIQYSTVSTAEFSAKTITKYGVHSNGSFKFPSNRVDDAQ